MKTIQNFLIILIIIGSPALLNGQDKEKTITTVRFSTSITCSNCVNTIMNNLPHEKGIKDVKCDLKTKEVSVTYQNQKNNPEQIKKSIERLGFTAKELTTQIKENKER
jgi:copper chaperone CopZ